MKRYLSTYEKKQQYCLLSGDILVLALSISVSYAIRIYLNRQHPFMDVLLSRFNPWQFFIIGAHLFTLYLLDLYNLNRMVNRIRSSVMVALSVWLAGLLISGFFFFFPKYVFGRQVLIIYLLVVSVSMVSWRWLFTKAGEKHPIRKRLAVVGDARVVAPFIREISALSNTGLVCDSVCMRNQVTNDVRSISVPLKEYERISDLITSDAFDMLAIDLSTASFSDDEIRRMLELKYRGKAVYDIPALYKNLTGKVPVTYINGKWLLRSERLQGELDMAYIRPKRIFDIGVSCFLLLLTAPFFVLIALVVKADSRGRIFFVQERLGIEKRPFNCVKFRTMVENAESGTGPVWSDAADPRVTRVGRFLRATRLDELPQLWNILNGDMSLVGPRPIRRHFADRLEEKIPFYGLRFSVKPGLSGWAQVNYGYAGSDEGQLEKFQYELFYIENMSFLLDLWTLVKTISSAWRGRS